MDVLEQLSSVVLDRRENPEEGSYTCYLFDKGLDKILKKVAEESGETLIAAKNDDDGALVDEICDLLYHLTVLMAARGIPYQAVKEELAARSAKIGNLKTMKDTDKNT